MAEDNNRSLETPEIPSNTISDTGICETESSESEDHFSDAQSGLEPASNDESAPISHIRVEKFEDEKSYGEQPSTREYRMREQDAAPDEIKIMREQSDSVAVRSIHSSGPIPLTVVEKVDPSSPSHGEIPGTPAYEKRAADAVPDLVFKAGNDRSRSSSFGVRSRAGSTPGDLPIPITRVERVDSSPSHGEILGTLAFEMRKKDAEPDILEEVEDIPGWPTIPSSRSTNIDQARRKSSAAPILESAINTSDHNVTEDASDGEFGDDFDEFEAGEEDTEFGDFNDDFGEAKPTETQAQSKLVKPVFPVLDFTDLGSSDRVRDATEPYINTLFPLDTVDTSMLPPATSENSMFLTARSASLWSQLVAPPPLQPPNWIRSRIRRLFLISLGVPIDLDEILPASKQKKLILPSMNINPASGSPRNSTDYRSISRLEQGDENALSSSVDSQGKPSRSDPRRRKGPPPAPVLDLLSARQLCAITDEALRGLTVEELKEYTKKLEQVHVAAKELLEYWTKRTDEKMGDRDAFEGVIENLVKHARKTRK